MNADAVQLFVSKMEKAGLAAPVINTFLYYYQQVINGESGLLPACDISPVTAKEVEDIADLGTLAETGRRRAKHAVIIILNGGLGTSMGLSKAKSLLEVKDGRSFLEIKLRQAEHSGAALAFMNSFNTHADTIEAISKLKPSLQPEFFVQNKFPKILKKELTPAHWPKDPQLEWNPPGHGDIYVALLTSGLLNGFLEKDLRYAFISNSDNLGATLDPSLLGYFSANEIPFMMEVAQRTPADLKGGHLARHKKSGRLILREIAQCPKDDVSSFQDIGVYRYFNTNNIWINLRMLKKLMERSDAFYLPMMLNPKTLDPRDKHSPPVYQIETAMGAAISLFQNAAAVNVSENRFHPVKTCNDLLAVRSDCYQLSRENHLRLNPKKQSALRIKLDPAFYGNIDMFEDRFKAGVPSLIDCDALTIEGNVFFERNIRIRGAVTIKNTNDAPYIVKAGRVVDRSITV
jgi:UTP--glucose-1-phosphate uridylyltransferase